MARNEAIALGARDRVRLQALVANRNTPQKAWLRRELTNVARSGKQADGRAEPGG
jgi:hypothetical protein